MVGIIKIDGELYHVKSIYNGGYLPMIKTEEDEEFYLADSSEHAGEIAANYWEDMAYDEPEKFAFIIGSKRLIQWGMNQRDPFGISNFEEFKEIIATVPEKHWASYDGTEREVDSHDNPNGVICSPTIIDRIGFVPTVAYRSN